MMLCALPLALLAIVAGMMLLAQTKKENLGNLYKYVSYFVIIMGFLTLLGIGARGAMRCCRIQGQRMMIMKERRMMNDGCMMGGQGMMGYHRGMMGGGCMMMNHGCCDGNMGCQGMNECHEGMNECHEGMGECHEGMSGSCTESMKGSCSGDKDDAGESCPMMKGGMAKKDSVKKK